jgi:hypothetical protein
MRIRGATVPSDLIALSKLFPASTTSSLRKQDPFGTYFPSGRTSYDPPPRFPGRKIQRAEKRVLASPLRRVMNEVNPLHSEPRIKTGTESEREAPPGLIGARSFPWNYRVHGIQGCWHDAERPGGAPSNLHL